MMVFKIDDADCATITKFMRKQDKLTKKRYKGAAGGEYTYTFTPTGIGTAVRVINTVTGDVLDISHYEEW